MDEQQKRTVISALVKTIERISENAITADELKALAAVTLALAKIDES